MCEGVIHLLVKGLITLPSGHFFSGFDKGFLGILLIPSLTYIIVLSPLLKEKHKSFIVLIISNLHLFKFKQKSLSVFQDPNYTSLIYKEFLYQFYKL